jgi:hypothetical protein
MSQHAKRKELELSPETSVSPHSGLSDTREAVERFYAAVRARDPEGIAELIDSWFAADVVVSEPDSLVYGGRYEGIDAVRRLFAGSASPRTVLDGSNLNVDQIVESVAESDRLGHVFVAVSFPLTPPGADAPIPIRAVHWWIFRDLQVASIEAFYWDTAAYSRLLRPAPPSSSS